MIDAYINNLIRACIALQVAGIDFANSDINDDQAIKAIEACYAEIGKIVKVIKKL